MSEWWDESPGPRKHKGNGALVGSDHPLAILNEDLVYQMRVAHYDHGWSYASIAKKFDVSQSAVFFAVSGRRWKHVAMEDRWAKR